MFLQQAAIPEPGGRFGQVPGGNMKGTILGVEEEGALAGVRDGGRNLHILQEGLDLVPTVEWSTNKLWNQIQILLFTSFLNWANNP